MNHGTLEKRIRLEKSLFNLIWLRMIKSNTIIDPTQSPVVVVVVVSAVGEQISYVNGDVMTQQRQHQSGSGQCEQSRSRKGKPELNQKSSSTELEWEKPWCESRISVPLAHLHFSRPSHTIIPGRATGPGSLIK